MFIEYNVFSPEKIGKHNDGSTVLMKIGRNFVHGNHADLTNHLSASELLLDTVSKTSFRNLSLEAWSM